MSVREHLNIVKDYENNFIKPYPTDGLTAEYTFDSLYGNIIDDSSGDFNNNSEIIGSGSVLDTGVINSGLRLSNDTYFSILSDDVISSNFSISMWTKFNDISSNEGLFTFGPLTNTHAIIQAGKSAGDLFLHSDYPVYSSLTALDSTWTTEFKHLIFIVDLSDLKFKLYVNSLLTIDMTISIVDLRSTILKFGIYFGETYGLNGVMDQVRIYNRALTQEEVSQLYNSGNGV